MKQFLSMFSVPTPISRSGKISAIVPLPWRDALSRLRRDDPLWQSNFVELHWEHAVNPEARIKVRDKIIFGS